MQNSNYDELYDGFNEKQIVYDYDVAQDEAFQNALKISSYGKRSTPKTYMSVDVGSRDGRIGTAANLARPTTAVRAVGYTSDSTRIFDPLNQTFKKTTVLHTRKEETPEQKYKNLENKISQLLEESALVSTKPKNDLTTGLSKAKEASILDRQLLKMRDQNGGNFTHNFDLTYSVLFNLANQYARNDMHVEALNTYSLMTKNKMFSNVNRLKINMGNIYFQLGLFTKAIKMYRMALDQVPNNQKELRLKITHNIGILFIKMGQYSDAATSFEFIMSEKGDLNSGLHLILCYYAVGDSEKMKKAFQWLLDVPIDFYDDDKLLNANLSSAYEYVLETIKSDELHNWEMKQKHLAEKNILMAANLISTVIESSFNDGYSWCVETIKNSNYSTLASEFDMNKAIMFLKQDDILQAIETLKYFERKDTTVAVNASINLTFIHLMKKDYQMAENYAESARKLDTYNPAIYINLGITEMIRQNYDSAKQMFESALDIDATSFEALYNLGLLNKKIGDFESALMYFRKLHTSFGTEQYPAIIYQIGNTYENMNDLNAALEWYLQLLGSIETDAGLLQKIAEIYEANGDRQQSFHYYFEAYRANPDNFNVANWIGTHFIELQVAERAINIYEKAYLHVPDDPYFLLRVAGIYRRIGSPQKSLRLFQEIHIKFPDNLDCLRALMHLSQTQGLNELYEKYLNEYQTVEKNKEIRQRIGSSRPTTTTSSRSASKSSANKKKSIKETNQSSFSSNTAVQKTSFEVDSPVEQLSFYSDPLGPAPERPRTGMVNKFEEENSDDDFNPDELLPM